MINEWLEFLSNIILQKAWLAPFLAIFAGLLTSLTPCSLSSVPLVIGCVGGSGANDTKKAFKLSVTFALGMSITFSALAVIAASAGKLVGTSNKIWYIFLGIVMIMMTLQVWEIYNFIPSTYLVSKNHKKGYIGALLGGILSGIFSSPCSTPVLIVILGIVAKQGKILEGIGLLLLYSIGHSVLILFAGTSVAFVRSITMNKNYGLFSKILKTTMGFLIMLIGLYMFYLGF